MLFLMCYPATEFIIDISTSEKNVFFKSGNKINSQKPALDVSCKLLFWPKTCKEILL